MSPTIVAMASVSRIRLFVYERWIRYRSLSIIPISCRSKSKVVMYCRIKGLPRIIMRLRLSTFNEVISAVHLCLPNCTYDCGGNVKV
jgi:hypothetical protein